MATTLDLTFLNNVTRSKFIPVLKQQIYQRTPLWNMMSKKGRIKDATGTSLIFDVVARKHASVGVYSGYDVLANQPANPVDQASASPANYYAALAISGEEERKNSGSMEKLLDMVKVQMDNAKATLRDQLSTGAFSSGSTVGGKTTLLGTQAAISTTNTYLGFDRTATAYAYWQANVTTSSYATADLKDSTSTSYLPSLMRTKITSCTLEAQPDLIVTTSKAFNLYQDIAEGKIRFDNTTGDLGFETVKFSPGCELIYDKYQTGDIDAATNQRMDFLTLEDWSLFVYPEANFALKDGGWVNAPNQDAKIAYILWSGQLICMRPKQQGALTALMAS